MEALLIKNDAWNYVNGSIVRPELVAGNQESAIEVRRWETADQKAKSNNSFNKPD